MGSCVSSNNIQRTVYKRLINDIYSVIPTIEKNST